MIPDDQITRNGTLYLIPTPIGNLGDITFRAVEIMNTVDLLLAEDTRTTRKLLTRYSINTPVQSYHGFNEKKKLGSILEMLHDGKIIGLVSDAGMPGLSDPGTLLASECHKNNIPLRVLPGASAGITAMVASGFEIQGHLFEGFLPKKSKERKAKLKLINQFHGAVIIYESPHRLIDLLKELHSFMPDRLIHIAREMSKLHEEHFHGKILEMLDKTESTPPRGEFVVVLSPVNADMEPDKSVDSNQVLEFETFCRNRGLSTRDSADLYAKATGKSRSEIYDIMKQINRG